MNYSVSRTRKAKVPGSTCSLLTVASKMPGPSFSIPAKASCPNHGGTICENCYAEKGRYLMPCVRDAQWARFRWTVECMKTDEGEDLWVVTMIDAISHVWTPKEIERYFRGHDSGDFFNLRYLRAWIRVCRSLPNVRFWFPSREYQAKASTALLPVINPRLALLRELYSLPNVTVRPSALDIGAPPPVIAGLAAGSAVNFPEAWQCPASQQDGHCGSCRHCWDNPEVPVSYPLH